MGRESPKVSGLVREYSRFAETFGGDGFDHDCLPSVPLGVRSARGLENKLRQKGSQVLAD